MAQAMKAGREMADASVAVSGEGRRGPWLVICDHASNRIPRGFGDLGLAPSDRERHFAWDPGALGVAERLAGLLEAPLVASTVSRLVVDCNRDPAAPDLIARTGDGRPIPGNADLDEARRGARIALAHAPFHAAIERLVEARLARGMEIRLVTVHSFTPVFLGQERPWHVGVVHDDDRRISDPLLAGLALDPTLVVGDNEPYSPADRVYYTLERHARGRGLACVMIEIRNDLLATVDAQSRWAERLAAILGTIEPVGAAADVREEGGGA